MRFRAAVLLLALGAVACGAPPRRHVSALPPPPPPPSGPPAPLRVIHASPDPTVARVALTVDTRIVADELDFGGATAYGSVPAGSRVVAILPLQLPPTTPPPLSETYHLIGPDPSTLIVHGIAGGSPALGFTYTSDTVDDPEGGSARVRFFHAAVGLGEVEICVAGHHAHRPGRLVFRAGDEGRFLQSATDGEVGPWTQLPAAAGTVLQLRVPEPESCHGTELGVVTLDVPAGARLTLVAVGRLDGEPAVEAAVLVCEDGAERSGCTRVLVETGR